MTSKLTVFRCPGRIVPKGRGEVNWLGLDFYDRLVDALLDLNVEPYITLYHWDLPGSARRGRLG